ncbi:MAG: hypothetical protein Q9180_005778 [Flavoplaca navasiana]
MDWTPSPTGAQLTLAAWRPPGHFQPGLGSLSVLPPEIRSKIWELIIPTTNFGIELRPEQKLKRYIFDPEPEPEINWNPPKSRVNAIGLLGASKQIHDEIKSHFFHHRGLAVIFTTIRDPAARRVNLGKAKSSKPGLILDGAYSKCIPQFFNFAQFASINLFIELPGQVAGRKKLYSLKSSVCDFSNSFQSWQNDNWLKYVDWHLGSPSYPRVDVVIYIRTFPDDMEDDFKDEPDLGCLASILHPLRGIVNANGATVQANYNFRYGKEWLPELLSQVANDIQSGKPIHREQWRQKNMHVALAQCEVLTTWTSKHDSGGPLPIGLPEVLTDNTVEYLGDPYMRYEYKDYEVFLATGELPYRSPGCPVNVDTKYSGSPGRELPRFLWPPKTSFHEAASASGSDEFGYHHQGASEDLESEPAAQPSDALESQAEQHSPTEAPALTNYSPTTGRDTTSSTSVIAHEDKQDQPTTHPENASPIYPWAMYNTFPTPEAEEAPIVYPWNKYRTSPISKVKEASTAQEVEVTSTTRSNEATKDTMPDAAKFTDLEMALMGILFAIVMFWLHKLV